VRTGRLWVAVALLLILAIVLALAVLYETRSAPPAPPAKPAATSSWYQLHFTTPTYPDRPENHRGGIDERLVAFVDSAQRSVDAAVYDFDLANVASALARAKQRGVTVRFVTDTDTWTSDNAEVQAALRIVRQAEIPVVDDQRGAIMHHKFMVVDGRRVWTGSWNWTIGDTYRLNNHAVEIDSPELAANYAGEFERMFAQRQFGGGKRAGASAPRLTVGGVPVESYFAPKDSITPRIVERVTAAASSVQFLAFSFTDDKIGEAMIARHASGVAVRGVFETTGSQTRFSEFGRMRAAGLEVYTDGSPYAMHHKLIVLDGRTSIFGSFNFSSNAAEDNDENILFVEDPTLALAFLGEIERVVAPAKQKQ
jgi:phosphatidylserine/phosphatidylglycerophosphate/cardiolipin synthase-like enzyme